MTRGPTFTALDPLPSYGGPRPVYRCTFPWAGAVDCYVRRGEGGKWETAPIEARGVACATFTASPVSPASRTRYGAVMAFDYYHGGTRS